MRSPRRDTRNLLPLARVTFVNTPRVANCLIHVVQLDLCSRRCKSAATATWPPIVHAQQTGQLPPWEQQPSAMPSSMQRLGRCSSCRQVQEPAVDNTSAIT
jgi:hypothetical protein